MLKLTRYKGEPVPFVMELPNYRFPSARSVGQLIWEKAKDFLQKAFTIIFVATVLIWFLQTFDTRLNVAAPDTSLLALIGSWVAPIFKPLGFGDWRVSTALITGFTAKESVVSTLTVLLGGDTAALSTMFTPFTAVVFFGVYPAVYPLRGRCGRRQARTWQCKSRRRGGCDAVRYCMGGCLCGTLYRYTAGVCVNPCPGGN